MKQAYNSSKFPAERNLSIDLIKTIAIVLVFIHHAASLLDLDVPSTGWVYRFYKVFTTIDVPLFFAASGALLLGGRLLPIKDFLQKRCKRILLPFLLWGSIMYIVSFLMHKYPEIQSWSDFFKQIIPYFLEGKINSSHWFVFYLIGIYLMTPFIQRVIQLPDAKSVIKYGLYLWLIWIILKDVGSQWSIINYFDKGGYHFIGYFLLGYYLMHYFRNEKYNHNYGMILFWSFALIRLAVLTWTDRNFCILEIFQISGLILWLKSYSIPKDNAKDVLPLSRYSYTFYLSHLMPLSAISLLTQQIFLRLSSSGISESLLNAGLYIVPLFNAAITLFICLIMCRCIEKIKWLPSRWFGI